jgi:hypothetical protein
MASSPLVTGAILLASAASLWVARGAIRGRERPDGAPALVLVRAVEAAQLAFAAILLITGVLSGGRLATLGHLWRHDLWAALLLGGLAGLFLHVIGGGSPLPIASLRAARQTLRLRSADADPGTVLLFVIGEVAAVVIWFGVGLPTLLPVLPRLLALPLVALGYGVGRAAAGQDHFLLGTIDGLLLGLLYLVTGSLVAVVLAHLLVDILAYVSAATQAEEDALAVEAGEPLNLPARGIDEGPGR